MSVTTSIAELTSGRTTAESSPLRELLGKPLGFNPDAWHVMQARDESLIRDQVLHGYASRDFIYSFSVSGKTVTGVSVVGARELASKYGGIKARIVATVEKRGALFIFRTFTPLSIDTRTLFDLADEDDYYECVMEVQDVKTGNSIEVRKRENRTERTREGKTYQRPHYDVIAESKAYRNGVLAILPQNVINEFEQKCLKAGNVSNEKTIDQLRDGAMGFAAKQGIPLDRMALKDLGYAELMGLGNAAKDKAEFAAVAESLGLVRQTEKQAPAGVDPETGEIAEPKSEPKAEKKKAAPVFGFAAVEADLLAAHKRKSLDDLDGAATQIDEIADKAQSEELRGIYRKLREEIANG